MKDEITVRRLVDWMNERMLKWLHRFLKKRLLSNKWSESFPAWQLCVHSNAHSAGCYLWTTGRVIMYVCLCLQKSHRKVKFATVESSSERSESCSDTNRETWNTHKIFYPATRRTPRTINCNQLWYKPKCVFTSIRPSSHTVCGRNRPLFKHYMFLFDALY